MNKLTTDKRCRIVSALVEGNSMRSTARMVGVSINTVTKLLVDLGTVCAKYQHDTLRNLPCERLQVDEIWNFCYAKEKNVPAEKRGQFGYGDIWTFTAICADTKIVPCWLVGQRDSEWAKVFVSDLADRLLNRVQLTSDGHKMYLEAVEHGFGGAVDYAMLVKLYGKERSETTEARYSPPKVNGTKRNTITGRPDPKHVSTSYVERQILTMRMRMRRFTRLTNAFSKKVENLEHAIAIHYLHYNFVRIHTTLKCTPAMKARVTDRVWSIEDMVGLLEEKEKSN